jgi:hypothetical protein
MKLFVWDFHGVLEKGNDIAVLEITNLALDHHNYSRRMTHQESALLSGRRWHEYFAFLLPKIEEEECFKLQSTCFEISQNQPDIIARHIQLNDHAAEKTVDILFQNIIKSSLNFINFEVFLCLVIHFELRIQMISIRMLIS